MYSHPFNSFKPLIRVKSSHLSVPLIFSFPLQEIRQVWIGTKLQEVGSQCQYEGWTFLHFAMAGADMSYLRDMCSKLFRAIEEDELVPPSFTWFGIPTDYLPHWEFVKKEGAKGGHKSVSYYTCLFCDHRSQNRTSTIIHTRCHLNVVVACHLCPFTSESTGPLENHIKDIHGGKFLEGQLTDVESVELVTKF